MNSRPGIEIRLARFLREIARRPFRMGQQDCGLMLADWRLAEIGIDPAREIRGHYDSTDEAMHLLGVSSLPMVFGRLCRAAGISLTTRPRYGGCA
jgi:hypothetical protein